MCDGAKRGKAGAVADNSLTNAGRPSESAVAQL